MKKLIIKILFRLLKIPIATKFIDHNQKKEWLGQQYPLKSFRDYISTRNFHILQLLGEGVTRDEEYWMFVGQRMELGRLLSEAKKEFEKAEAKRNKNKKKNENNKNKKS